MPTRSLRIRSDGTPSGTEITTPKGEKLDYVTSATVRIETGDIARVDLEIILPMFDANAIVDDLDFICPVCETRITHHCNHPEDDSVS